MTDILMKDYRSGAARPFVGRTSCLLTPLLWVLLTFTAHAFAYAGDVTLGWNPSGAAGVTGYRLYYGTRSDDYSNFVDVGNRTSGTLTGLQDGVTYYAAATAYDARGVESRFSNEVSFSIRSGAVVPSSGSSAAADSGGAAGAAANSSAVSSADAGGGGGGGCFIATATFGSYVDPHVRILRSFRDTCLLTNAPGRLFVKWYYAASPPVADVVRKNGTLRAGVRLVLIPVIGFCYLCLFVGLGPAAFFVILSALSLLWLGRRYTLPKGLLLRRHWSK